jgi:hypothetical protein
MIGDTLTISRIVFLLFVVVLSVYFVYLNNSMSSREHFTDGEAAPAAPAAKLTSAEVDQVVADTYKAEFKRDPSGKELTFWQAYAIEKKPSQDQLVSTIKGSAEIISKAYENETAQGIALRSAFGTEDDVIEVYSEILGRNPDEDELYNFAKMLKDDKSFNLEKLKQILYGSEEYYRLEKTQTNMAYSSLAGGVTERQITLIVMTHYKEVTGKDTIEPDELRFLKKKLVEFNMSSEIFDKFLRNYMKDQPFNQQLAASQKVQQMVSGENKASANQESIDAFKKELFDQIKADLAKQSLVAPKESYTDPKGNENSLVEQEKPNRQVIEVLLKTSGGNGERNDNYLDSSDVIDSIKKQASCVFNKNAADQKYAEDRSKSMAELISARNNSQLKDTCVRNKSYLGLDEDMVLDPSLRWKLPERRPPVCVGGKNDFQPRNDQTALIGTLLEDASKTKVGSAVDFHPPKR